MPYAAVTLRPGVDVEKTLSLNEAGYSQSQLLRYKNGIAQTLGGWVLYNPVAIPSTVRDIHPWMDVNDVKRLGVGATANLMVVTAASASDITPQISTTNPVPNFSISSGSNAVTVNDPDGSISVYNSVFFNTPVAIGNLLLNGAYQITSVLSTGSYVITSSIAASTTITSSGILPIFTSSAGSAGILVTLPNNNFQSVVGLQQSFRAPTTVGGLTVSGAYNIASVLDSTTFYINANTLATASTDATMNSSLAQLVYYVTLGPQDAGTGFGAGGFGDGGFGTGTSVVGVPGTPITATDWTQDNWGEILLSCPTDGAIYAWSPQSGFTTSQVITTAPFFNGGIFISMPQQILVAWRSVQSTGTQDNLIVRWSDAGDYTNWEVSSQTTAGSFHIPTGSIIVGGLQAPSYGIIWTDVDVWIMQYVGGVLIFNFTRVGSGCGLIGPHAAGVLADTPYWCGKNNFYVLGPNGAQPIPCTVWDFIFQNLNTEYASKIRCAPNSAFNEITWFFPSTGSMENDSYVKLNIADKVWDCGLLPRTSWCDVSIVGNPIGSDTGGYLYQHEMGESNVGAANPSFQTGWWAVTEGNDIAFVDYIIPDFKFGTYSGEQDASINLTFFAADYPGATPRTYGPYTITSATEYITPRIRGRLMSMLVQSNTQAFWRQGKIRYRYSLSGRR